MPLPDLPPRGCVSSRTGSLHQAQRYHPETAVRSGYSGRHWHQGVRKDHGKGFPKECNSEMLGGDISRKRKLLEKQKRARSA